MQQHIKEVVHDVSEFLRLHIKGCECVRFFAKFYSLFSIGGYFFVFFAFVSCALVL